MWLFQFRYEIYMQWYYKNACNNNSDYIYCLMMIITASLTVALIFMASSSIDPSGTYKHVADH